MQRFTMDLSWPLVLGRLGLHAAPLLRAARLPADLLSREAPTLSADEYLRLWQAMELMSPAPGLPIRVVEATTPEGFSPPLLACFSSPDLATALERLATYKALIGPMRLTVSRTGGRLRGEIAGQPGLDLPPLMAMMELMFKVNLARAGTQHRVVPARVTVAALPDDTETRLCRAWFGRELTLADTWAVEFEETEATRPFTAANPALYAIFRPVLEKRLAATGAVAQRLRAALVEALPAGETDVKRLAARLAMSQRTLQRKLGEEGLRYQDLLAEVRGDLARLYLTETPQSLAEIAFLLGYRDANSFHRAFHGWTGETPGAVRARAAADRIAAAAQ
ncbi:AraC family transcriptional regulator [Oceanicola sp. 22II-s10i]|uniref:AraC family transcriptional regulator n=1 Tax=Oceanicola sp. 22II-s10i TaxID=1317116 RepID=UPI000B523914|nr:AraC family transcriptional regulator [Oceanicola sp. 22II-s10i]